MSEPADAPLDDVDAAILAELAAAYASADPPPADLNARVTFAIAIERDLDIEVARLTDDLVVAAGTRATEQPRTLTFDCDALTVMVTVVGLPDGRRRLDGWLAPAGNLTVEVRAGGSDVVTHTATADETGRFVVDSVPPGLAQLSVYLPAAARTVITPAVVL